MWYNFATVCWKSQVIKKQFSWFYFYCSIWMIVYWFNLARKKKTNPAKTNQRWMKFAQNKPWFSITKSIDNEKTEHVPKCIRFKRTKIKHYESSNCWIKLCTELPWFFFLFGVCAALTRAMHFILSSWILEIDLKLNVYLNLIKITLLKLLWQRCTINLKYIF